MRSSAKKLAAWVFGCAAWSGVHAGEAAVPLPVASTRCFSTGAPAPRWDGPAVANCTTSWTLIGQAQGATLYQGRYSRPSPESPDARLVTEVLFRGAGRSPYVMPVHAVEEDEADSFLKSYAVHAVAGRSVIELTSCLNGTGGCSQDFLEFVGGKVMPLAADIEGQVKAVLPAGFTQLKSPVVDLDTLRGEGGAWAKDDPDCCPSYKVVFDVELSGQALRIRGAKVSAVKP